MATSDISVTVRVRGSRALTVALWLNEYLPRGIKRPVIGAYLRLPLWWARVEAGPKHSRRWVRLPVGQWYAESKEQE